MARTVGVTPNSYVLNIALSGGTRTEVTRVKLVHRTTGEFIEVQAVLNNVAMNLADLSSDGTKTGTFSGFSNSDVIEIRCHGGRMGSATHTVDTSGRKSGGKVTVTVVDVTATNTPGLTI